MSFTSQLIAIANRSIDFDGHGRDHIIFNDTSMGPTVTIRNHSYSETLALSIDCQFPISLHEDCFDADELDELVSRLEPILRGAGKRMIVYYDDNDKNLIVDSIGVETYRAYKALVQKLEDVIESKAERTVLEIVGPKGQFMVRHPIFDNMTHDGYQIRIEQSSEHPGFSAAVLYRMKKLVARPMSREAHWAEMSPADQEAAITWFDQARLGFESLTISHEIDSYQQDVQQCFSSMMKKSHAQ